MEVVLTFAAYPLAGTGVGVAPRAAKLLILAKNVLLFICRSSRFVLMNSLMALWGRIAKKIKSRKKVGLARFISCSVRRRRGRRHTGLGWLWPAGPNAWAG